MQFSHDYYKEMLYAAAEYYDESIVDMDIIKPEASYCNADLRDKLFAMHLPEVDRALKHVSLSKILDIWDLLEVIEGYDDQKVSLDVLATFANTYPDEFGCDSMICVSNYLADNGINEAKIRKLAKRYLKGF